MSTEGPSPLTFLTAPVSPASPSEMTGHLPILVALACIFLLLATCLLFMMLCKPAALDPSHHRARECMPHHPGSPNEPQLRLWKRLGSLRCSLHSFRRGWSAPQRPLPSRKDSQDCECMESTKM